MKITPSHFLLIGIVSLLGTTGTVLAQGLTKALSPVSRTRPLTEKEMLHWGHLDPIQDTVPGMSIDRAYAELIKKRKGQPILVAIIDSGIDLDHEDLKGVLWKNPKEIAGDGIDNDQNGYVDAVSYTHLRAHETLS
jgi:cell wall-associated protease